MQDRARAHTVKLTLEMLRNKKQFSLLEPHHWPPNSPNLSTVDFWIWELLKENVYPDRNINDLNSLKEAIPQDSSHFPKFPKKSLINVLTYLNVEFDV